MIHLLITKNTRAIHTHNIFLNLTIIPGRKQKKMYLYLIDETELREVLKLAKSHTVDNDKTWNGTNVF